MTDDIEPATIYKETKRKAAKDHRCGECGGVITKGEEYYRQDWLFDGGWSHQNECPDCRELGAKIEHTLGGLKEWIENGQDEGEAMAFLAVMKKRNVNPATIERFIMYHCPNAENGK